MSVNEKTTDTPTPEVQAPAATVTEAADLRYLDPLKVRLTRADARIDLAYDQETPVRNVALCLAFPLSEPARFVSVRDEKQVECGIIADPCCMDADSLAILTAEIRRRYVTPVVRRVLSLRERFEIIECCVETDRGPRRFSARNLRENILRPQPHRYVLTDVDGNRFDIPDLRTLPPASQALLLAYL